MTGSASIVGRPQLRARSASRSASASEMGVCRWRCWAGGRGIEQARRSPEQLGSPQPARLGTVAPDLA